MQDAKTFNYSEVSLRHRFNNDNKLKAAIQICYKNRNEGNKAVLPRVFVGHWILLVVELYKILNQMHGRLPTHLS